MLGKVALVLHSFPGLVLQLQSYPYMPYPTGILMHHLSLQLHSFIRREMLCGSQSRISS